MTGLLALTKKVQALEALPTQKRPLRIEGGEIPGFPHSSFRATIKTPSGHVYVAERKQIESIPAFVARISAPGSIVTLGGLPPLPIDQHASGHFPPYLSMASPISVRCPP
jgi:hypothetical protein